MIDHVRLCWSTWELGTSRDRPKSAPYQGSKIAKGLQNAKVLVNWGPFYEKNVFLWDFSKLKGGPFGIFQHPFCRTTQKKLKGDPWGIFFQKKSHSAEKTGRGTLWSRPVLYVTRETVKAIQGTDRA